MTTGTDKRAQSAIEGRTIPYMVKVVKIEQALKKEAGL